MTTDMERAARALCAALDRHVASLAGQFADVDFAVDALRAALAALPAEGATGATSSIEWAKVHDGDIVIVGGRKITMRVEPFRADAHPAPADAGAACCQASRRAALEQAVKACERVRRRYTGPGGQSAGAVEAARMAAQAARECADTCRTLAQGGAA